MLVCICIVIYPAESIWCISYMHMFGINCLSFITYQKLVPGEDITYQEACPWKRLNIPLSEAISCL